MLVEHKYFLTGEINQEGNGFTQPKEAFMNRLPIPLFMFFALLFFGVCLSSSVLAQQTGGELPSAVIGEAIIKEQNVLKALPFDQFDFATRELKESLGMILGVFGQGFLASDCPFDTTGIVSDITARLPDILTHDGVALQFLLRLTKDELPNDEGFIEGAKNRIRASLANAIMEKEMFMEELIRHGL